MMCWPDEDGYIGRCCSGCEGKFRMLSDEYVALPDGARLTCPYCGREDDAGGFMTDAQRERARAALLGVAQQWTHQRLGEIFGGLSQRFSPGDAVRITHTPSAPPPIRPLPEIVEEKVIRTIACPGCGTHYARSTARARSARCAARGRRPIPCSKASKPVALRSRCKIHLPADQRDAARAAGVFDRLAADTVKNIVGLFEVFARNQFNQRVANPAAGVKNKGNIFQCLDDTAQLFSDHCSIDLPATVGPAVWQRLRGVLPRAGSMCSPTATG